MKKILLAVSALGLALGLVTVNVAALFSDTGTSSGNTFATTTLAAPTLVAASVGTDGQTVTLNWSRPGGSFATGEDVFASTTSGSYGVPNKSVSGSPTTFTASSNSTWYFKLQSSFQNWRSPDSSEVSAKPIGSLGVSAGATQTVGSAFNVTVTAKDTGGATMTGFTGLVTIDSATAGVTVSCASGCTQAFGGVTGTKTFSVTLVNTTNTSASVTLRATYAGVAGGYQVTGTQAITLNKVTPTIFGLPLVGAGFAGTAFSDSATLLGGHNPSGAITFKLFTAADSACGTDVTAGAKTATVSGAGIYAPASGFTIMSSGTYFWRAIYSGDNNNNPVSDSCQAPTQKVVVAKAYPLITFTPSPLLFGVHGTKFGGTVTLTGVGLSGTISLSLTSGCGSGTDLSPATFSVTTSTGGSYSLASPTDQRTTIASAGVYYWQATYTPGPGDTTNNSVTTVCAVVTAY